MSRRLSLKGLFAVLMAAAGLLLTGCSAASSRARPGHPEVAVTIGSRPTGQPLAPGFVGLSLEYTAVQAYADRLAVELIRKLSPGERPVLRIGGDSTDEAWWPQPGEIAPRHATYALGPSWLKGAKALASALDAKLIMGLNLAGGSPSAAADEARAFLRDIGPHYIETFEIGNEPDLYGLFPWPQDRGLLRRPASYSLSDYLREFSRWRAAIGSQLPVTGPAYATFDWSLGRFIESEPGLKQVTFHHYPLDACLTDPKARGYPTIPSLLRDQASTGFAAEIAPEVAVAHAHHIPFRLDELNSASCGGKPGVSNSPASALWMLDTLFALAKVGVDGVNIHTFPGAPYAPFDRTRAYPEYYGMLMFSRAFPAGARLLPVTVTPRGSLKAWATTGPGRAVRVVLINEEPHRRYQVQVHARDLSGRVRLERLLGGSSTAAADVITVPAASAVLLAMS